MAVPTIVERLLNRTKPAEDLHSTLIRKYDRAYETYRAIRTQPPKGKPRWESDLRVPYASQVIDTALVNIVGGKPRAVIKPRHPENAMAAEAMQLAMDYYMEQDHLAEKQVPFTQQGLVYGGTLGKSQWLFREIERPSRMFGPDPLNPNEQVEYPGNHTTKVVLRDGPTFEPWDIYDAWWEPNARDVETAAYFVLRSWMTKDEVQGMQRTEANPFGWDNVKELLASGQRGVPDTRSQDRFIGGGGMNRKDRFEILEIWTNDRQTVMSRDVLLKDDVNPFWHGQKPIVFCTMRPDLFSLQGIPETDLVADLQEALWTLQNMRFDNMHLTVQRGITYRESGVTDPNALELKPRFKWAVTDHDDIRPFEVQPLPNEAWREDDKMMGQIQHVTGITPFISGTDLSGVDQNTATGVTALQEVASRLLRFKARAMAYSGYQRIYEQWVDLTKQFMTKDMSIRIEGADNQYSWRDLKPQDVIGDFDTSVEGTEESLSRQQERGEAMGLLNAFAPFAQLPGVNMQPVLEKVAKAFDMNPKAVWQTPPAQPPAAPMAPGQPPPNGAANGAGAQYGQQPAQQPQVDPRILQAMQAQGGIQLGSG